MRTEEKTIADNGLLYATKKQWPLYNGGFTSFGASDARMREKLARSARLMHACVKKSGGLYYVAP